MIILIVTNNTNDSIDNQYTNDSKDVLMLRTFMITIDDK